MWYRSITEQPSWLLPNLLTVCLQNLWVSVWVCVVYESSMSSSIESSRLKRAIEFALRLASKKILEKDRGMSWNIRCTWTCFPSAQVYLRERACVCIAQSFQFHHWRFFTEIQMIYDLRGNTCRYRQANCLFPFATQVKVVEAFAIDAAHLTSSS